MKKSNFFVLAIAVFLGGCATTQTAIPLAQDQDNSVVQQENHFITKVAPKYGLGQEETKAALSQATFLPKVIALITKPAEKKSWADYSKILVTPERINAGKKFINENAPIFKQEANTYGVPPSIVAGIIGVETYYGKQKGTIPVLDSLATLAFGYPKRADFFQNELAQFLALAKQNAWGLKSVKGSYAGAFGLAQFMPSSFERFAVNNGGSKENANLLIPAHAIMSVGNYLHKNGWRHDDLIAIRVQVTPHVCQQLTCNQRKPNYPVSTWLQHGVVTNRILPPNEKASLILLDGAKGQEAWLTFKNFYVITTYNISINYAMAVYQISQGIQSHTS